MTVRTSVRPSAPQGYQYTSYIGCNPVLNPVCFWQKNRLLTRVVAKQAKTTIVKNKFVNGKKEFKRILSCGRGKVQFRRKKLGDKVQAKSSNLPRRFCSNSVGTPLEFAAFRSGFDAKYSRASLFWFFLSTTMVFTAFRTHFARKNTRIFKLIGNLSQKRNKY